MSNTTTNDAATQRARGKKRDALLGMLDGVCALGRGIARAVGYAASREARAHPYMTRRLLFTPALLAGTYVMAAVMRIVAWPATATAAWWTGEAAVEDGWFVELAAAVVFTVVQELMPAMSSSASLFFETLRRRDSAMTAELEAAAVQNTHGLLHWLVEIVFTVGCIAVCAIVLAVLGPAVVLVVLPVALLAGVACNMLYPLHSVLRTFRKVWKVDSRMALAMVVCIATGLITFGNVGTVARFYYASLLLAKHALAQYADRLPPARWAAFTTRHRWDLVGFALPVYALGAFVHPLCLVASLQLLQAAASELVVDSARPSCSEDSE
eukprot:TRINITY_DN11228_c0_g1_i1.p1 TRINITY_DN11228_c0_g1~~TRINITY_DN11228_c0_g1_i1.p1  ORF type:complete len:325 (+),score=71.85 TRINITY_DN11228_c0_g1_i1:39-1013(+)